MIVDVSKRIRGFLLPALAAAVLVTACNSSDARILGAAESLVPPQSDVTEVTENDTGLSFEAGPHFAIYEITDGGLGPALEGAIEEQAQATGWEMTERSEKANANELRFARDDLEAIVAIWINRDPVGASIHVNSTD